MLPQTEKVVLGSLLDIGKFIHIIVGIPSSKEGLKFMAGFSDAEEQLQQSVTDDRLVNTIIATMQ